MINWNEFRDEARKTALEKGWDDGERPLSEVLMLIVSELAEATECVRRGDEIVHEVDGKLEGEAVELSDVCIRICDYFGYKKKDLQSQVVLLPHPSNMNGLQFHFLMTQVLCSGGDVFKNMGTVVASIESWARGNGVDLVEVMLSKMEFNKTRPRKHGKLL